MYRKKLHFEAFLCKAKVLLAPDWWQRLEIPLLPWSFTIVFVHAHFLPQYLCIKNAYDLLLRPFPNPVAVMGLFHLFNVKNGKSSLCAKGTLFHHLFTNSFFCHLISFDPVSHFENFENTIGQWKNVINCIIYHRRWNWP